MLNLCQGQVIQSLLSQLSEEVEIKLVFSNTHKVSISAIYVNDVIVQTAIESHSER